MKFIGKCLLLEINGKKILVVGDLHLGYEEALNKSGVFVFRKQLEEMVKQLRQIFKKTGKADEVVLLGDVKHTFGKITKQEWQDVTSLFDYLKENTKKISVIRGNHDAILGPIVKKKEIVLESYYIDGSYCFLHGNKDFEEIHNRKIKYWVIGHGHPAVAISDGVKIEKYKCFLVGKYNGKNVIILPSFFEGNAGSDPRENDLGMVWKFDLNKFDVKIVQDNSLEVLDFGKLGKLR